MTKPKYNQELFPKWVEEYLATTGNHQMKLPTMEGLALAIGVHRDVLYDWEKAKPETKEYFDKVRAMQKEQLMNDGMYGGKEVNSTMAIFLLKVNHDMIEKTQTDITSMGEKLAAPTIILDTKPSI